MLNHGGYLNNGGGTGAANPTAGSTLTLLAYGGPVSADAVTIGLRQSIAAGDALLAGSYSKALTFELANTAPQFKP